MKNNYDPVGIYICSQTIYDYSNKQYGIVKDGNEQLSDDKSDNAVTRPLLIGDTLFVHKSPHPHLVEHCLFTLRHPHKAPQRVVHLQ